ncbi:hypothetical protein L0657_26250 [Dyadobacter sp. CY345]|uniref:hypothetical protein n=1 Tax=Dyadobacter sp. CY345 TaxID=2909335 RepID=UPI001F29DE3E|nr:hypothetical protein [Dyadobacter sp. CY345]MCF2447484.1 hypothetical protein [Dyadobacter sp. CY345]
MNPVKIFGFIFIILFSSFVNPAVDKGAFYKVFGSNNPGEIDEMIALLEKEKSSSLTNAFLGALHTKKAGFLKGANEKIKIFKKGASMLEVEIAKKPANTEYRFLRLAIQEHAPKILKYNKNKDADKKAIIEGYKNLDPELQKIIKNYASGSATLKVDDLQ